MVTRCLVRRVENICLVTRNVVVAVPALLCMDFYNIEYIWVGATKKSLYSPQYFSMLTILRSPVVFLQQRPLVRK